ncbi:MAG: hypothetical protein N3A61_06555 [Ignavibacteria bacterium]|nr:hypothetical protein [Ignavibacteria bacterium]
MIKAFRILLLTTLIFYSYSLAQVDTSAVVRITFTDDSEIQGQILEDRNDTLFFRSMAGINMSIPKSQVNNVEIIKGYWMDGKFRRLDPNRSRLLFAPTGRTLDEGKGYFSVYELFFPFLSYGITDFLTISGGFSLAPGLSFDDQMKYIAPKIRVLHTENIDLSGGVLYASVDKYSFGIAYAVGSFGRPNICFTGGLGWGFVEGKFSDSPLIMIGAEAQISNSIKWISECWIPPEAEAVIVSLGIRFFGDYLAADFALLTTTKASGSFPFLPWLGFAYNF